MVEIIGDDLHIPLPVNAGVAASDTSDIPDDLPESVISLRQRIHYKRAVFKGLRLIRDAAGITGVGKQRPERCRESRTCCVGLVRSPRRIRRCDGDCFAAGLRLQYREGADVDLFHAGRELEAQPERNLRSEKVVLGQAPVVIVQLD